MISTCGKTRSRPSRARPAALRALPLSPRGLPLTGTARLGTCPRPSRLRLCEVNRHWRSVLLASGLWSRVELEWPTGGGAEYEDEQRAASMLAYCASRAQVLPKDIPAAQRQMPVGQSCGAQVGKPIALHLHSATAQLALGCTGCRRPLWRLPADRPRSVSSALAHGWFASGPATCARRPFGSWWSALKSLSSGRTWHACWCATLSGMAWQFRCLFARLRPRLDLPGSGAAAEAHCCTDTFDATAALTLLRRPRCAGHGGPAPAPP